MDTFEDLQTIYEILETKEEKKKKGEFEPLKVEEYIVPEFNIPISNAKGSASKRKKKLSQVLSFIEYAQYLRFSDGCTLMPIPQTSKRLLSIWGSQMSVSRGIKYMEEIGLISPYVQTYRFHVKGKKENYSKLYRYYKDNEDRVLEYCKRENIVKYEYGMDDMIDISLVNTCKLLENIPISRIRFKHNIRLFKPENYTEKEFEDALVYCLCINYPMLELWNHKVKEINERFYKKYPDFRLSFYPSFTWSKSRRSITSIGIRVTNPLCNLPKEERKKVIKQYGFNYIKDIKSSVPRLTLSLNTGKWIEENIDIYELIFRKIYPHGIFREKVEREIIKSLFMRAYFDVSKKSVANHTWRAMNKKGPGKKRVYAAMGELRDAVVDAVGGRLFDNEIFYFESLLYLMTLYDLLCCGIMTWLLYDCFYSKDFNDEISFEELITYGIKKNFLKANMFLRDVKFIEFKHESKYRSAEDALIKNGFYEYKPNCWTTTL